MNQATKETKTSSKVAAGAFIALPLLACVFSDHTAIAIVLLLLEVALVAYFYSEATTEMGKYEVLILGFVALGTPSYIVGHNYFDGKDRRQFASYLAEHKCKEVGSTVVGMSSGGCDRAENCVEPEEIEQTEYFCQVTGKRIVFDDFVNGRYGYK